MEMQGEDFASDYDPFLGGKFGDWFKRAVSNVAKVSGALQEATGQAPAAAPLPPPKPAISPVMIAGAGAGIIVLVLLLSRRR